MSDVAIIVPCFNEAERLDTWAFRRFLRHNSRCRFVFVDDGSQDATLKRLEELQSVTDGRICILSLTHNQGKAEAVRQGLLLAISQGFEHVGFWDADLATPLGAIPEFIHVLDNSPMLDMVIGTRLSLCGRQIARNRLRGVLGTVFAMTASTVLGVRIRDTQCGAKLFRSTAALWFALSQPFLARWIFDVELLARLAQQTHWGRRPLGETVYEYPLDIWREVAGSKLKLRDFLRAPAELALIYSRYVSPWARPLSVTDSTPVDAAWRVPTPDLPAMKREPDIIQRKAA